jgi:pantoate--beta-alanine ligase
MGRMAAQADVRVVSIFANPTQFGPTEDFGNYPRTLESDIQCCESAGVSLIFVPDASEIYMADACTKVSVQRLTERYCGLSRPGHFDGVALVVSKLLNIVQPDIAYFGQKDFQQLRVIERMARDLDFPVAISMCLTVREPDGLAMSSRNSYLTDGQRAAAPSIYAGLRALDEAFRAGESDAELLKARVRSQLDAQLRLEYLELADNVSLEPREKAAEGDVVLIAARIGATKLIDNIILGANNNHAC